MTLAAIEKHYETLNKETLKKHVEALILAIPNMPLQYVNDCSLGTLLISAKFVLNSKK